METVPKATELPEQKFETIKKLAEALVNLTNDRRIVWGNSLTSKDRTWYHTLINKVGEFAITYDEPTMIFGFIGPGFNHVGHLPIGSGHGGALRALYYSARDDHQAISNAMNDLLEEMRKP